MHTQLVRNIAGVALTVAAVAALASIVVDLSGGTPAAHILKPSGSKSMEWKSSSFTRPFMPGEHRTIFSDGADYQVMIDAKTASALAAACYNEGLAVGRLQGEIESRAYMVSDTTLTAHARKILSQGPSAGCGGK